MNKETMEKEIDTNNDKNNKNLKKDDSKKSDVNKKFEVKNLGLGTGYKVDELPVEKKTYVVTNVNTKCNEDNKENSVANKKNKGLTEVKKSNKEIGKEITKEKKAILDSHEKTKDKFSTKIVNSKVESKKSEKK